MKTSFLPQGTYLRKTDVRQDVKHTVSASQQLAPEFLPRRDLSGEHILMNCGGVDREGGT